VLINYQEAINCKRKAVCDYHFN